MPLVAESAPQGLSQVLLPRAFALQRDGFDVGTTKLAAQEGVFGPDLTDLSMPGMPARCLRIYTVRQFPGSDFSQARLGSAVFFQ